MPQVRFWPFMARTMIEVSHVVKPLPLSPKARRRSIFVAPQRIAGTTVAPFARDRESAPPFA